jgi:hypothetical protein
MKPQIFGAIVETVNGMRRLRYNVGIVQNFIRTLKDGERVWITLSLKGEKRTDRQNKYLHLLFNIVSEWNGDDPKAVKEYFRREFLEPIEYVSFGKVMTEWPSTANLTKKEFSEATDRFIQKMAEMDVILPIPSMMGIE